MSANENIKRRSARVVSNSYHHGVVEIAGTAADLDVARRAIGAAVRSAGCDWDVRVADTYPGIVVTVYGTSGLGKGALKSTRSGFLTSVTAAVREAWKGERKTPAPAAPSEPVVPPEAIANALAASNGELTDRVARAFWLCGLAERAGSGIRLRYNLTDEGLRVLRAWRADNGLETVRPPVVRPEVGRTTSDADGSCNGCGARGDVFTVRLRSSLVRVCDECAHAIVQQLATFGCHAPALRGAIVSMVEILSDHARGLDSRCARAIGVGDAALPDDARLDEIRARRMGYRR